VELTEAGHLLLRHANAIIARVHAAESDFSAFRNGTKGSLRVGTYQSIGARVLPRLLPRFASDWPDIEVQLAEGLTDAQLLKLLETGELDLSFTTLPAPPGPFEAVHLLEDPYVLVVPRDTPLGRRQRPIAVREAGDFKLLGVATCQAEVSERLKMIGMRPAISFPSADNAVIQGLVAAGVGAGIVPLLTVDTGDDRVTILPIADTAPRTLGLAWHADRYHSPAFAAFKTAAIELCTQLSREMELALGRRSGPGA
jgi:DNA-binding transcriptional LysR family regulator